MANEMGRDRDLVLAPGEFAFVLDTTKGQVNVNVGPYKTSMAGTDQPVIWDKEKLQFIRVDLERAIQRDRVAPEGFYLALYNPANNEREAHPPTGKSSNTVELNIGHRVNIPGPANFSLWPGQMVDVIRGHHMRSNQYLLAQVYNDHEARENWQKAVVKPQGGATTTQSPPPGDGGETKPETPPPTPEATAGVIPPLSFAPGQMMVIKGTEVAFFIPPTGIKVVPENGQMVREAVTLERLEYSILLDENGNKRFVRGPAVVFPNPTETFIMKDGKRKFEAIELNETTGIYIKVIADYDEGDKHYTAGDELFITGKEQAIYFQREEHSIIRYDGQTKHYAVAIPAGEGRYVLNRMTGVITLVRGPRMLLCDPRFEVIIRRVLSENTVKLWYPESQRALDVNRALAALNVPEMPMAGAAASGEYEARVASSSSYMVSNRAETATNKVSRQIAGDTFSRGTKFTPPRTITLDTKYEGAVNVTVWTGYAVLVIPKVGDRHVVQGPESILLEYDETLATLELSSGRPKTDEKLIKTVYLRVQNNKVSDKIRVETADLVPVWITVSYRVNFEGEDKQKWFAVENYVQLLCDHMRSLIRNAAKRRGIEEFYSNTIDIVRDTVLGPVAEDKTRPGQAFSENGMRVYDVEVLDTSIDNANVAGLLSTATMNALRSTVQIAEAERMLAINQRAEVVKRESAKTQADTVVQVSADTQRELEAQLEVGLKRVTSEAEVEREKLQKKQEEQDLLDQLNAAELGRQRATEDQEIALRKERVEVEIRSITAQTDEIVKRTAAVTDKLAIAMTTLADQSLIEKMTTNLGPMAAMSGVSTADILANLFKGSPFEGVMKMLGTRSRIPIDNETNVNEG